jgi:hypothetical protein
MAQLDYLSGIIARMEQDAETINGVVREYVRDKMLPAVAMDSATQVRSGLMWVRNYVTKAEYAELQRQRKAAAE